MTGHMTSLDWFVFTLIVACLALWGLYELARWARRRIDRAVADALAAEFDQHCTTAGVTYSPNLLEAVDIAMWDIEMGEAA